MYFFDEVMNPETFKTDRLLLTPTSVDDASLFLELLNTPKWIEFIGDRNVKTLNQAKEYISSRVLPQYKRLGYGNYTVALLSDGAKIGCCGLYDRKGLEGVDIGFSYLPVYERQGYGYEAASCIKEVAFNQFKLQKIGAITAKKNIASQRLLEKLGLVFIKKIQLENDPEELHYYELTK